jgi:hypothetical protein
MAKKRRISQEEELRQSRKEVLLARKQERQNRQVRLAVGAVVGLLLLVLVVGLVNEVIVKPTQPVAVVNGSEITMRDWQERVRLQRAQLIIGIEDLAEALGQDIGQVQQFAGQQINLLLDDQSMGQVVLDELINEELIRQGAEARNISVTDEDVQTELEVSFNYFGGSLPTPIPTATETPIPTPSLTPIPTPVITEVVPTATPFPTPTLGPTATPLPTATPVTLESFQESLGETLGSFEDLGVSEASFRELVRAQLIEEALREELAVEEEVPDEGEQVSFFYLTFDSEAEAQAIQDEIAANGFVETWNRIRSMPADDAADSSAAARELVWRTRQDVAGLLAEQVAEAAFSAEVGQPSDIIVVEAESEDASDTYYILQVSGREIRPLTERAVEQLKSDALQLWLDSQLAGVEIFDRWRTNVPTRPLLDGRFLVAPTPVPATPTLESVPVVPVATPTNES